MRYFTLRAWLACVFLLIPTSTSFALASNQYSSSILSLKRVLGKVSNGVVNVVLRRGSPDEDSATSSKFLSTKESIVQISGGSVADKRPLKVLFLSADTGGGHRASAEALGKQFAIQFPGSTYELADLWTDHGVLPYRTLVATYKRMSARPWEWRLFYHLSNTKLNEVGANLHSKLTCMGRIFDRIESYGPDVVVSVHPTMNHTPLLATQKLGKKLGKHIPFFTVVTDLGSGHCMWFEKKVNKLYVASDRLYKLARRRGGTPAENIVMAGLPIRHGFSVEAEKLGDRTTEKGKEYQKRVKEELQISSEKPMVLVMGGGEGVGSLSAIVDQLYTKLTTLGVDATICVVCGRNEKLKAELESRDWNAVSERLRTEKKRRGILRFFKRRGKRTHAKEHEESYIRAEEAAEANGVKGKGQVDVVGLGFITNMPEYMVAADILVTKAGPGTIAEAASVGLPVMLTSFLPGQEAGNVDVVLESGYGDYCEEPTDIAKTVGVWLHDSELVASMSLAAQKAGHPYAADEIVTDIGNQAVAWMYVNEA